MYLCADVQDADSLTVALDEVRKRFGRITGLIHAAGVLADKKISDKTEEQFRRVFATKVEGLRSLLAVTAEDPLELIVCFSSVAARYGNAGQCDYAAANEVLNQVAGVEARRRGETCLVKSIGWGPWEGGMVTPGLAQQFKSRGMGLIPLGRRRATVCRGASRTRNKCRGSDYRRRRVCHYRWAACQCTSGKHGRRGAID